MNEKYNKLLKQYYNENIILKRQNIEKILYRKYGTDKKCFRCGSQLLISDLKEYKYLCLNCDENYYKFETIDKRK